jgi:putative SOS response-associated peptidase YedK
MCNAYAMKIPPSVLVEAFHQFRIPLVFPEGLPNAEPTDWIRPTDPAPVIQAAADGAASLSRVRWGLPPSQTGRPLLINMRSEGRTFRDGRALIPASWFYEYTGSRYPKTRWTLRPIGQPFVTFAGLVRETPVGTRFTLLTVDAGPDIQPIHGRQPAIVAPEDRAEWLVRGAPLHPSPAGTLEVFQTPPEASLL